MLSVLGLAGALGQLGHHRMVGDAMGWQDREPKVSPAACPGGGELGNPLLPSPSNPLMLFQVQGDLHLCQDGFREQIDGEQVAQGSVLVCDPKSPPSCPRDTLAKSRQHLHCAGPALPNLTQGFMPS